MEVITRMVGQGVYLVIDTSLEEAILMQKLAQALQQPLAAVQVWDHFEAGQDVQKLLDQIVVLCHQHNVPVLINNQWQWLRHTALDGVHFDVAPPDLQKIRAEIDRPFLCGLALNNDLAPLAWATENGVDYVSFCAVFPSPTSNSCVRVAFETIAEASAQTNLPIFLSGGITPQNIAQLRGLAVAGVAVVSGIMHAVDPAAAVQLYNEHIKFLNHAH